MYTLNIRAVRDLVEAGNRRFFRAIPRAGVPRIIESPLGSSGGISSGRSWGGLWALLALAILSGCGHSRSGAGSAGVSGAGSTGSSMGETSGGSGEAGGTVSFSSIGKELYPLEIELSAKAEGSPYIPTSLPDGALFDETTHVLRWIPEKGQAGTYTIPLHPSTPLSAPRNFSLMLSIGPYAESDLANGPPPVYRPEDVGYVFVHGAGTVDRCADRANLAAYWGLGPSMLEPLASNWTETCYNASDSVASVAGSVADQILSANCGNFNKCIVVTHSMGGLLMEHLFTHTRPAVASDPVPSMFADYQLYQAVRARTLFVISLASAAGGSKVADIVDNPSNYSDAQYVIGTIADWVGSNEPYTQNLDVKYSSDVVAPMTVDPGVPFFMVGGFSIESTREAGVVASGIDVLFGNLDDKIFNGNVNMAEIDLVAGFSSRDDGLVDFRSSCGVMSDDVNWGPGVNASLQTNLALCYSAPKKPNHYVWFMINTDHEDMSDPFGGCAGNDNPCQGYFPSAAQGTFVPDVNTTGYNDFQIMMDRLAPNALATNRVPAALSPAP